MEDDKLYLGPESPADPNRSQGAKNTRTEEEIDEIINLGTYLDDTLEGDVDDRPDGTSTGDTAWTSEHERGQQTEADNRQTSENDNRWESSWSNQEQEKDTANRAPQGDTFTKIGGPPQQGDTANSSVNKELSEHKKRLSGAQRRKLARESGKTLPSRPKGQKRPADNSLMSANAPKRPLIAPAKNSPKKNNAPKRQRIWCCDIVRKKPNVFEKLKHNPQATAIAVNTGDLFGVFSPTQYDAIIRIIMKEIMALPRNKPFGNEPFVPRFHWHRRIEGLLVFWCVDPQTANWLCNINFSNAWDGAKLRIVVERDFSKLVLCKTVLSGPEKTETDIMKMWKLQNKDINFTRWDIKEKKQTEKGTKVIVLLDVPSLRTIRSMGMKLYYGLSRSLFHVLSPGAIDESIDLAIAQKIPTSESPKRILPSLLDKFTSPNITSNISPLNIASNLLKLNNMLQPNPTIPSLMSQITSFGSREPYSQTSGRFDKSPQSSSRFEEPRQLGDSSINFEAPRSSSSQQYGSVRSPLSSIRSPPRSIRSPSRSIRSPSRSIRSPSRSIRSPSCSIRTPARSIRSPSRSSRSPTRSIRSPTRSIRSPSRSIRSPPRSIRSPPRPGAYQKADSPRRSDNKEGYWYSSSQSDRGFPPLSDYKSQGGFVRENYSRGRSRSPQRPDDRIRSDRPSADYRFQSDSLISRNIDDNLYDRNKPRDLRDIDLRHISYDPSNSARYTQQLCDDARFLPYSNR